MKDIHDTLENITSLIRVLDIQIKNRKFSLDHGAETDVPKVKDMLNPY